MKLDDIKPDYSDDSVTPQNRAEQVFGMFKTVSVVPTSTPKNWFDQIQLYKNGGTLKVYIYDVTNAAWRQWTVT